MGNSIVVDEKEEKQHGSVVEGPIFSPDGRHVAYRVREGGQSFVVVDGEEGKRYDCVESNDIGEISVSSKAPALVVIPSMKGPIIGGITFDSHNHIHYLGAIGNSIYLVEGKIK